MMPFRFNEPRRHRRPRARYYVRNWPKYGRALQQRGSLTVWITPEAHTRRGSRPELADKGNHATTRTWRSRLGTCSASRPLESRNSKLPCPTSLFHFAFQSCECELYNLPEGDPMGQFSSLVADALGSHNRVEAVMCPLSYAGVEQHGPPRLG